MNGSMVGAAKESAPASEVESLLDMQQNCIDDLHSNISTLERRLAIALRPVPPSDKGACGTEATCSTSQLCSAIDSKTDQVRAARRRIESLIDCLTT